MKNHTTGFVNAKWFQTRLINKGLTQRKLAEALGVDPSAITQIFKGKRKLGLDEATTLARVLGVTLGEVLVAAGLSAPDVPKVEDKAKVKGIVNFKFEVEWGDPHGPENSYSPFSAALRGARVRLDGLRLKTSGSGCEALNQGIVFFSPGDHGGGEGFEVSADDICRLAILRVSEPALGVRWLMGSIHRGAVEGKYDIQSIAGDRLAEGVDVEALLPVLWIKL